MTCDTLPRDSAICCDIITWYAS